MKIRNDFVTNSSSSSFIISKHYLDEDQLNAIRKHEKVAHKLNLLHAEWDDWKIEENEEFISGYTFIDNFDISKLLYAIEINPDCVYWDEYKFDLDKNNDEYKEKKNRTLITKEDIDWRDYL